MREGRRETAGTIECPEHGRMERVAHRGVLVAVRCGICGKRPIDLLQERRVT